MQFAMETQEFPNSDSVGFQSLGPGVVSFACIHFSDTPNISYVLGYVIRCVYIYPPTPAFAKAGAAPGTTAGVELFPTRPARKSYHKATAMAQGHLPAAAMASYRRSRLPFARPQTLQTLQNPPNAPKVRIAPQGQGTPTSPNTRHSRTQKPPQGHSNGSRAPSGRSNGFL